MELYKTIIQQYVQKNKSKKDYDALNQPNFKCQTPQTNETCA